MNEKKGADGFISVAIAVAVLALFAAGGWWYYARKHEAQNPAPAPQQPAATTTPATTAQDDTSACDTLANNDTRSPSATGASGLVSKVYSENGTWYMDMDYVIWGTCSDANADDCPDGYRIINDNPKIRTLPIDAKAPVCLIDQQTMKFKEYSPSEFATCVSASTSNDVMAENENMDNPPFPYNLYGGPCRGTLFGVRLDNGTVTGIMQEYTP